MKAEDWIKVTDRLPENDDLVLTTYRNVMLKDIIEAYYLASYIAPLKRWVGDGLYGSEPTHWMPIVPPKS